MNRNFYITTPIYYPSNSLHIGNAYPTVACDTMARYMRSRGYDVFFLTGADEHGQKIERAAAQKGCSPKEYVDEIVADIQDLWALMNISYDDFLRTTEQRHIEVVQRIFTQLYEQGDIYKGEYEGWYCTPCESYWTQTQLKDGKCPDCGRDVEKAKEESYFLRLSKYADRLEKYINDHPEFIQPPSRKNEMINNFIRPGLEDLAVSRTSFKWGVPVPFDPDHVIYVWMDAVINYISALGYGSQDDSLFLKFWPADVHVVGKEIVRFHTIVWPIILMALDLPLPRQVFGHGWLTGVDGDKLSKSKGNSVAPRTLISRYGLDSIRYFLLREMPFGADGAYSHEALIGRINSDLANDLGNLVSRTSAMIQKYFGGTLSRAGLGDVLSADAELAGLAKSTADAMKPHMKGLRFSSALSELWKLISRTNKYIDETEPWALARDEADFPRLADVLYNLCESIRIIATLLAPFMPDTAEEILEMFSYKGIDGLFTYDNARRWGLLPVSFEVKPVRALFPRIDLEKELEELRAPEAAEPAKQYPQILPEITIDDFAKLDLRAGTVVSCEPVPKSDKLLRLMVDIGSEVRQVVSGIAMSYKPEELVGKKVALVCNLKPAKLRGVESRGMIMAADMPDGGARVLFVHEDVENGGKVR